MSYQIEVKPLTHPSPQVQQPQYPLQDHHPRRRRHRCIWCGGCCIATLALLGITILVLFLTVFKAKDPEINLNAVYFDNINLGVRSQLLNLLSVNATLTADISLKNPNAASFKFQNSTTEFYYEGQTVGVAYAGSGVVKAHKTVRMNVTIDVMADKLGLTNATSSILTGGGSLNVTTFTDVAGRVNLAGIYKKHMEVEMNCSMTLQFTTQLQTQIENKICFSKVKK